MNNTKNNPMLMQQVVTNDIVQVLETRNIHFNKAFTREYCYEIIDLLDKVRTYDNLMNTPKEELYIRLTLCTEGGSILALFSLLEVVEKLKEIGYTVHTHCNSMAASCGFVLFCGGNHRTVSEFAFLLNHQGSSMTRGTVREMEVDLRFTKMLESKINDYLRANTGMAEEEIARPYVTNTDIWYNAQECVDKGIAHKIVNL